MNLLYLSLDDVKATGVTMARVVDAVEEVLTEKGKGNVEMPPKPGIHPLPEAFIHAMPAYIPKMEAAGVKWVSGFPQNLEKKLPYITGLLILNDPQTGFPISVMDCTWITAKRTGAATAVAAKYLARPDSTSVAIFGCGVQGRSNLEALKVVFPKISRVQAYDVREASTKAFCEEAAATYNIEAIPCSDPRETCKDADIVVTAIPLVKEPTPVIDLSWIREGAFVSPVDLDSYVKPEIFNTAARFFTDDLNQQDYFKKIGYFQKIREPDGDLGELLTGREVGRSNAKELIVSMNIGLALEDMATAVLIYRAAKEKGIGRELPL